MNFYNKSLRISMQQEHKGKVLVTGASGYIASHIIRELLQKGY